MVTEIREAQRLPVLKHEGKVTIVTAGARWIHTTEVAEVEAEYDTDFAQYHSRLYLKFRQPRKKNFSFQEQTAESVCAAIIRGHGHSVQAIESSTDKFFSPAMFPHCNPMWQVEAARLRNAVLGYCGQQDVLAVEMFGLNFFESDYWVANSNRFQCGCERIKRNSPTGIDCLKAIFPDRWQQVERFEKKIVRWHSPSMV
jgi:hypothetical protein